MTYTEITVKVKTHMKFSKIFEAAEVCFYSSFHLLHPKLKFCSETIWKGAWSALYILWQVLGLYMRALRFLGTFKFTYDGQRVGKEDTPASVSLFCPT